MKTESHILKYSHYILLGAFLMLNAFVSKAQSDDNVTNAKLKKILTSLTYQDKLDILNYAHQLRDVEPDDLILKIFDQLPATEKKYVIDYAKYRLEGPPTELIVPEVTTVEWDMKEHDFAKIIEGKTYVALFKVTNTGESPYQISNVRSSCDCTITNYPKSKINPGEEATLVVEFNSIGKLGMINQGIVVYDNTENKRSILYLKGEVVQK
ncbi:MAG: DUF1573 domain-containing protein [Saprospiraceae bacterium]|nr:DUF1573 domain-containing protein [Saprospiraceae bacterium]